MDSFLVVCPLKIERDWLKRTFIEKGHFCEEELLGEQNVAHFPGLGLILAIGGLGKAQFAVQTSFFLNQWSFIQGVFCVGSAGSLSPDIQIGDVVVATSTVEHDFKMKLISRPLPQFSGEKKLIEKITQKKPQGFCIHQGLLASGDEDIVEPLRVKELKDQTKAMAVAWEGAGGARACRFYRKPFLEVRGITDHASQIDLKEFPISLEKAMRNVASCFLVD